MYSAEIACVVWCKVGGSIPPMLIPPLTWGAYNPINIPAILRFSGITIGLPDWTGRDWIFKTIFFSLIPLFEEYYYRQDVFGKYCRYVWTDV